MYVTKEYHVAFYRLSWDERMRSTFDHDRFPEIERFSTFEDARKRVDDVEFDQYFDISISEETSYGGESTSTTDSWKVQS